MARHGWVEKLQGSDRRERRLRLTPPGIDQFNRALPVWQKVQTRLRRKLGGESWQALANLTNKVTSVVTE
jgi:DNA-binding MarR family transcriptional regulator